MNGKYVTFDDIVLELSSVLGLNNLHNQLPVIKRYIVNAEKEINPYKSLLVKKRMTYHKGNGNFDGKNIVLPKDFNKIDTVGSCKDGLCSGAYIETPTFIVLCDGKKRDKITFTYFGIACDGTGNPFIVANHKEAVIAYIEYMFYRPNMNKGTGNMNYYITLQRNWEDRCMEARGEDFMEEIVENLDQVSMFSNSSIYDLSMQERLEKQDSCECQACFVIDFDDNEYMNKKVYFWQFSQISSEMTPEECSSEDFLKMQNQTDLKSFMDGYIINYTRIAKYGFAIEDVNSEDDIEIYDLTGSSIKNSIEKYYDTINRRLIVLSNNIVSHSSIYFKFKYNGK